jgi:hypothetical protein
VAALAFEREMEKIKVVALIEALEAEVNNGGLD